MHLTVQPQDALSRLTVKYVSAHFVQVLESDGDGVNVTSLVVFESVFLKHRLDTRRDDRVSKLWHGGEHVVLDLKEWRDV
jgi:hypothetical protein